MADSRSFLANQKARNAIVAAENLLTKNRLVCKNAFALADCGSCRVLVMGSCTN